MFTVASATTTQSGVTLSGVGANMVITEDVALITSLAGANQGISTAFLAQPFTVGSAPAVVTEVKVEFSNNRTPRCRCGSARTMAATGPT